jgi:hypothetical protein
VAQDDEDEDKDRNGQEGQHEAHHRRSFLWL